MSGQRTEDAEDWPCEEEVPSLSPANDEIDPALLRELFSQGDQRLLSDDEVANVRASTAEATRAAGSCVLLPVDPAALARPLPLSSPSCAASSR